MEGFRIRSIQPESNFDLGFRVNLHRTTTYTWSLHGKKYRGSADGKFWDKSLLRDAFRDSVVVNLIPPSTSLTLAGDNLRRSRSSYSYVTMLPKKKKKLRPPFAVSSKIARFMGPSGSAVLGSKKARSLSLVNCPAVDVAASASQTHLTASLSSSSAIPILPVPVSVRFSGSPVGVVPATVQSPASVIPSGSLVGVIPATVQSSASVIPSGSPVGSLSSGPPIGILPAAIQSSASVSPSGSPVGALPSGSLAGVVPPETVTVISPRSAHAPLASIAPSQNYASLLKKSSQLKELGTPVEHVSGVPFVMIPDKNIESAKLEFKDFIYARFHSNVPTMGRIIGIINAVWAKSGPKIYVHDIGNGCFLLRVTNARTREVLLSRSCWNIAGSPMFVAPWSPDFSPDEAPLTSAVIPVEMRNVPYLLFNNESLSRLATAVGKPDSLAPETERKENFDVAKMYVKVDLTKELPRSIVSGFSNGHEVIIDISYPWLPVKCDSCSKFGHKMEQCRAGVAGRSSGKPYVQNTILEASRKRSKSRPGRSRDTKPGRSLSWVAKKVTLTDDGTSEGVLDQEAAVEVVTTLQEPVLLIEDSTEVPIGEVVTSVVPPEVVIAPDSVKEVEFSAPPAVSAEEGTLIDEDSVLEEGEFRSQDMSSAALGIINSSNHDAPRDTQDQVHESAADSTKDDLKLNISSDLQSGGLKKVDDPFFLVNNKKSGRKVTKQL
ncbi:BnaA09g29260D [Brassica napus]|uniref:(rape) hypothetical protein n=1 Tax=Brassica napus TaxID=3708 RepID=A0A078FTL8_BRANA|nr:unnamed protein product [Brassica napus]CDY16192.1 BnaA09g29260D [Brassica napus]